MNTELIEKLSAIREDLLAFQTLAQAGDLKKLADLAKQKVPMDGGFENVPIWRNYQALYPYMTTDQASRAAWVFAFGAVADGYFKTGKDFTGTMTKLIPLMLTDLDDIAKKLQAKIT